MHHIGLTSYLVSLIGILSEAGLRRCIFLFLFLLLVHFQKANVLNSLKTQLSRTDRSTALMCAVRRGSLTVVNAQFAAGSDLQATDLVRLKRISSPLLLYLMMMFSYF